MARHYSGCCSVCRGEASQAKGGRGMLRPPCLPAPRSTAAAWAGSSCRARTCRAGVARAAQVQQEQGAHSGQMPDCARVCHGRPGPASPAPGASHHTRPAPSTRLHPHSPVRVAVHQHQLGRALLLNDGIEVILVDLHEVLGRRLGGNRTALGRRSCRLGGSEGCLVSANGPCVQGAATGVLQ